MNRVSPSGSNNIFTARITVDPGSVTNFLAVVVPVPGILTTDHVLAVDVGNIDGTLLAINRKNISSAGNVAVLLINNSGAPIDLGSATWTFVWYRA